MLLSVEWRKLVHHMEGNHLFTAYQFRSRTGRCYLDPIMIKEIQNKIYRCSKKIQIKANLDATACYDQIIPGFSSIASQEYGMHKNICIVQANTLEEAKYY